ncbi:MAG: cysteine--tRNA ligase [Cephaloticoccus sp.]|nr:cysteine--tRNA ligase [Cephaloticoccus sp.]
MALRLHDSLTRTSRELRRPDPADPQDVFTFYNCGPTVYAPAHIGNFRTNVVNDVIRRLLELEFGRDKVKHVRNLTDVDDKTIRRAREEGRPLADVTKQWTDKFQADCKALNLLPPHVEPTATGHIREQVDMIEVLMKKGNAYRAPDGSVYFKVSSFDNYGRLSRVKERELKQGSAFESGNTGKDTVSVDADEKEDATDFALWKAHKPEDGDNGWDSPWGRGRPGWHIECSAMSKKHLGNTIDLHTGGVDLLFPHHENEIAQSECCNGVTFARHWYHSEHLLVDGKKMSKSEGTLFTLDELLVGDMPAMAIRYALLAAHPRKQLNFTFDSVHAGRTRLHDYRLALSYLTNHAKGQSAAPASEFTKVIDALNDDLNTPLALGLLATAINGITPMGADSTERYAAQLAGLQLAFFALGLKVEVFGTEKVSIPQTITALAEQRWAVKQAKDFATADKLRADLTAAGWSMLDRKDGYSLEPLKNN